MSDHPSSRPDYEAGTYRISAYAGEFLRHSCTLYRAECFFPDETVVANHKDTWVCAQDAAIRVLADRMEMQFSLVDFYGDDDKEKAPLKWCTRCGHYIRSIGSKTPAKHLQDWVILCGSCCDSALKGTSTRPRRG
jgi:hypothetical protein